MKKTKVAPKIDKLSRLLAMTANPTRLRIFCMMYREKNACVGEIADEIGMSVASISHHLQLLKQHGSRLIRLDRRAGGDDPLQHQRTVDATVKIQRNTLREKKTADNWGSNRSFLATSSCRRESSTHARTAGLYMAVHIVDKPAHRQNGPGAWSRVGDRLAPAISCPA